MIIKSYNVTYYTKQGDYRIKQVLAKDLQHCINSAMEMTPDLHRIKQILPEGEW